MHGLTSGDAARRLASLGPNELTPAARVSFVRHLVQLFVNPLVLILVAASAISMAVGQSVDALIIVTIVVTGAAINFSQTWRSERAIERLRASVATTATVLRDGEWREIPVRQVVDGDVVRLSAGDLVPADATLLDSRDLAVQQSVLTGESLPVDKHAGMIGDRGPLDASRVFLGTSIVSGTASAVVTATGARTAFGEIASRVGAAAPPSEFEHGLRRFSLLILRLTIVLVLFILLVALALHRDPIESLLFAVALGVGLTPEFLPMIVSVTLAAGATRMARHGVIVKRLRAIQNFGSMDVLCSDKTGTLTTGEMHVDGVVDAAGAGSNEPLRLAAINSRFQTGIHSPLDAAILAAPAAGTAEGFHKVDEIPFDFERRLLSVVVDDPGGRRLLITKGAPEAVLAACDATFAGAQGTSERLAASGQRVLAVACRVIDRRAAYSKADERGLTLSGFVVFADPVEPDAAAALADLAGDGVTVKILTGDDPRVARSVCDRVHIRAAAIVTGAEIDRLDDGGLAHVAEQAAVFARVTPAQKNRLILALKRRGHVVGFLGDGINDAPSLHAADIGISVKSATDVAREAADVILGRRGLRVLHRGILEGRRASGNMMKYLLMGTSSNFGNMFSMAAASVFLPFLPMLPTQILLNNLLYDAAQITIPADTVDREYLTRPQRWDTRLIRNFMLLVGPVSSIFDFLTFYVLLRILHAEEREFHTGWFVESLATQTLVLLVIRTMGNPLKSRPAPPLIATVAAVVIAGLVLPVTSLAGPLGFTALPASYLLFVGGATAVYLFLVQIVKRAVIRLR